MSKNQQGDAGESDVFFRSLAESIPQFVWTTSPDGRAEYFNGRWLNYTGRSTAEGVGHGWTDIVHPADVTHCLEVWNHAVAALTPYEVEFRLRRFDGAFRWHLAQAVPVKNDAGEVIKWFGTCTDIHAQKCLALEREEFMAAISHDLKSPLMATVNTLTMLANGSLGDLNAEQIELLRLIISSSETMTSLAQNLLDVFRYEREIPCLHLEDVDLNQLIQEKIAQVDHAARSKNISIVQALPEDRTQVIADRTSMDRVLHNLLDNAVKFTPPGGEVALVLSESANKAIVSVSDNGPGIPPDELPLLFQPFSRGNSGRHFTAGSGLGLYICRQIMQAHNGEIWCASEPGNETTFHISMPLAKKSFY